MREDFSFTPGGIIFHCKNRESIKYYKSILDNIEREARLGKKYLNKKKIKDLLTIHLFFERLLIIDSYAPDKIVKDND